MSNIAYLKNIFFKDLLMQIAFGNDWGFKSKTIVDVSITNVWKSKYIYGEEK